MKKSLNKICDNFKQPDISVESPKKKRGKNDRKKQYLKQHLKNGQTLSKLNKNCKHVDLSRSMDPKHKKHEQNYIKTCSNQIAQISCKENTLKAAGEKGRVTTGRRWGWQRALVGEHSSDATGRGAHLSVDTQRHFCREKTGFSKNGTKNSIKWKICKK